ncbi:cytochrome P450 [Mycena floridula]|nr:cytochrome P450 [Mycena floridula]
MEPRDALTTVACGILAHYLVFKRSTSIGLSRFSRIIISGNVLVFPILVGRHIGFDYERCDALGFYDVLSLLGHLGSLNVTFLLSLSVSIIAYRLSPFHPLAEYPGPVFARISKWWMAYQIGTGRRHLIHRKLHEQYGAWVRIGPNELTFNEAAAIRPIYTNMFRAPFYQGAPGEETLVTTIDKTKYLTRLAAWNRAFTTESIKSFRCSAQARTSQLISILSTISEKEQAVDLSHWLSLWATDTMGDMSFSGGFESMAAGADTEGWIGILNTGVFAVGVLGQVPWMRDMVAALPQPGAIVTFQKFIAEKVREIRRRQSGVAVDILSMIQNSASGEYQLSDKEAEADATFMVVAGTDTVNQAAHAFFRYIIADGKALQRLKQELDVAFEGGAVEDMDAFTLGKLPFLDACIQETLRLRPPVSAGPPRYSGNTGMAVKEHYIPPHTTIACPIYSLHRDSANFSRPDDFLPERWIDSSGLVHNPDAFIPFSAGIGICIGKAVALHNLKFLAASMIRSFDLSFHRGFDLATFEASYKEYNLWQHDPLILDLKSLA